MPIDEIRLAYYDSNNKRVEAKMIQLPDGWENMSFDNNKDEFCDIILEYR